MPRSTTRVVNIGLLNWPIESGLIGTQRPIGTLLVADEADDDVAPGSLLRVFLTLLFAGAIDDIADTCARWRRCGTRAHRTC